LGNENGIQSVKSPILEDEAKFVLEYKLCRLFCVISQQKKTVARNGSMATQDELHSGYKTTCTDAA